jgi:hypothetical protein
MWDKIWWIIHWKLYNYATTSTCICFLGHKGMRNGTKKEKQFDVIAKSNILSSLYVGVFNRVFNCENAHELLSIERIIK